MEARTVDIFEKLHPSQETANVIEKSLLRRELSPAGGKITTNSNIFVVKGNRQKQPEIIRRPENPVTEIRNRLNQEQ